jgi:hypothetical protein
MNFAAILPRFPQVGFWLQSGALRSRTTDLARPQQCTIPRHGIVKLENRPMQLRVMRGWVWITRDGCMADTVLGAGEVFEQRPGAPVLVQALEDAELSIAGAGPGPQNA